ncbi:hypothetical protein ABPG72_012136 [Tetrahymena utriculariae]
MSTSTNNQRINKILDKLNGDKMQILRIQLGNKNITTIICHMSQNETMKQIDKINIITDQIEKTQDNLGIIILGDFNINQQDEKQWKKLNKKFSNKLIKNIKQNTRTGRQIDDVLISRKLNGIIQSKKIAVGQNNEISDHKPILIQIKITKRDLKPIKNGSDK